MSIIVVNLLCLEKFPGFSKRTFAFEVSLYTRCIELKNYAQYFLNKIVVFYEITVKVIKYKKILYWAVYIWKGADLFNSELFFKTTVLQNRLYSFHWPFLENSMINCISVLSQKPIHILPFIGEKKNRA